VTIKNYRMPYKGSKNKIADQLIDKMLEIKPNAKYFVDFFGGGASMSFKAMQKGLNVIYNDKDKRTVELLKLIKGRIVKGERSEYGLFPKEYYNFVSMEDFKNNINDNTAYAGFLGCCYSFGNDFKYYFCSKEKEEYKKLLHNVIVFNCKLSLELFNKKYNFNINLSDKDTIKERRLDIIKLERLQQLEQLERLESLEQLPRSESLEQLQQLQQLEQLERLESLGQLPRSESLEQLPGLPQLPGLEQLEILNLSYDELLKYYFNFKDEDVILYCDPPYRETSSYQLAFDYDNFINYLTKSNYTFFVSEYCIENFIEVFSVE